MEVVDGGGPDAGNVKMEGGPPLEAEGVNEAAQGKLINTTFRCLFFNVVLEQNAQIFNGVLIVWV